MKKLFVLLCCLSFFNCFFNDNIPVDPFWSNYEAVTLSISEFENSIKMEDNKPIIDASKIYIIGHFIFINDKRTGFHIFDNTDTSSPIKKKFLKVPGATDIAIRNNVLYINQATDLVALTFDFNTLTTSVSKRVKNVFPEMLSPNGESFYENDKVVVNWIEK